MKKRKHQEALALNTRENPMTLRNTNPDSKGTSEGSKERSRDTQDEDEDKKLSRRSSLAQKMQAELLGHGIEDMALKEKKEKL